MDRLLVSEVSGVDDPANGIPGWALMKSADELNAVLGEYEKTEKANADLLSAMEGAMERMSDAPEEVVSAMKTIVGYLKQDGGSESPAKKFMERVRDLVKREKVNETEEIEVTKEELNTELDNRFASFAEQIGGQLKDTLTKALEPAKEEPVKSESEGEDADKIVESLAEVLEKELNPVREALMKTLDRVEALEKNTVGRTSLEGQDDRSGDDVEKSKNTLRGAIRSALDGKKVELR